MNNMPDNAYRHRLHKIDPPKNQYRFYTVHVIPSLFGEWSLVREWGRIGSGGTLRFDTFVSENEAIERMQTVIKAKMKKGYLSQ